MENLSPEVRRCDIRMAERVDCGIAVQAVAGSSEAVRYMVTCGVPQNVIERVLAGIPNRRKISSARSCDRRKP
jgi:hypothetical protein